MGDDHELEGLDPCDFLDAEAARIDAFLSVLADDAPGWNEPTGCDEWNRRDLLAHLASGEEYHQACFDDAVGPLFEKYLSAGATSLHDFNRMGIEARGDRAPSDVLAEWRAADARTRQLFRERGDANMATSAGAYPAWWQAFHVASELATHADDLGVPITPAEADARREWRARFSRFSLMESKPELRARMGGHGRTTVEADGREITLSDDEFVSAVAGRLPPQTELSAEDRALLSTAP